MPNRILKESICTSESIDGLSWFEECLFYRLIVNCDDYGRFDGRPAVIKARLFPLKERITAKDVSSALMKLADAGVVITYVCEGKPYLYLPTWEVHQSVRAKKSKYPSPDDGLIASVSNCMQMNSDECKCSRNPTRNPNPNPNPNTNTCDCDDAFDKLWDIYPKHQNKADAKKAFAKAIEKVSLERMMDAVNAQKSSDQWQKNNGQFVPMLATWLRNERWADEVSCYDPVPKGASGNLGEAELEAIRMTLAQPMEVF